MKKKFHSLLNDISKDSVNNNDSAQFSLESILTEFSSQSSLDDPSKVSKQTLAKADTISDSVVSETDLYIDTEESTLNEAEKSDLSDKIQILPNHIQDVTTLDEIPLASNDVIETEVSQGTEEDINNTDEFNSLLVDEDSEPVIDVSAYDEIYARKQRNIKIIKARVISLEKAAKKANSKMLKRKKIEKLRPATLAASPIPLPKPAKVKDHEQIESGESPTPKKKTAINPLTMMKRVDKAKKSFAIRSFFALLFTLPLIYMAMADFIGISLPSFLSFEINPLYHSAISLSLLLTVVFIGYDVYFGGCYDLLSFRATTNSLVFVSSLASIIHCLALLLGMSALRDNPDTAYMPITVLPALSICFSLFSERMQTKSFYRSLRSSYRLTRARVLNALPDKYDGDVIFSASESDDLSGFYDSMRERDSVSVIMRWFAPLIIVISVILSIYSSRQPNGASFFWCFAIITAFTPALGLFLASSLPHASISKRMFKSGVLLGGGSAISRLGKRSFVILNDSSLFSGEAISISGFKLMRSDLKELALSYTSSLLDAAGTSLAKPFLRLASDYYAPTYPVSGLIISDTGGITGKIDGRNIMVGNGPFIQRSGIKIPPDIKLRTAVFCALDGELLAIFAVKYHVTPRSEYAMNLLIDNGYFPIIATRDFNVTASFIQTRFGIGSSDLVYPPVDLRLSMSEPSRKLDADGVILARGNGDAIAETLVACHRYKKLTRLCLVFSLFSSIMGLGIGFVIAYQNWSSAASPANLLLYYLVWLIPFIMFAGWINKF